MNYFSVGAFAAWLIQRVSILWSSPEERSSSIASDTHGVSGEPFASKAPH
jgi:hypothetical protein